MKRIHLIHTNDLHSHLESMAKVDTYVSNQRLKWNMSKEDGFLLDIGDHLDRVRLETEGTNGLVNRAILEESGYDVVTLGNNELLTFSHQELFHVYEDASFEVVCSNVRDPLFEPYRLYERNGVKIAFIGVTVPYFELYAQLGWSVKDPIRTLSSLVAELRQNGYIIVILSHLGYPADVTLAKSIPEIDIIMGGHTHHLLEKPEKIGQVTLAAAGKHGQYIGHLWLECSDSGNLEKISGGAFPLQVESSKKIMSLVSKYRVIAKENLSEAIVHLEEDLPVSWESESPLPNLLSDSLVKWTGEKYGLVNNGQLLYSLSKGLVTKEVLHAACPHPINPVVLAIKGGDLRLTLEESLIEDYTKREIRGFGFRGKILGSLAVSGMSVIYDVSLSPFQKIKAIYMGDELLEDEKIYHVATISMLTFGIGYTRLKQAKVVHYFLPDLLREVLAAGLQSSELRTNSHSQRWFTTDAKEERYGIFLTDK